MENLTVFKVKEVDSKNQVEEFELLFMNADDFRAQLNCLKSDDEAKLAGEK